MVTSENGTIALEGSGRLVGNRLIFAWLESYGVKWSHLSHLKKVYLKVVLLSPGLY